MSIEKDIYILNNQMSAVVEMLKELKEGFEDREQFEHIIDRAIRKIIKCEDVPFYMED